jgi:hypothetical protein
MPKQGRTTANPLGKKFLEMMKLKGIEDDYTALAAAFGVKVPSVYDWIDHGRFSKARYAELVRWSGRSLDWWFDIPPPLAAENAFAPMPIPQRPILAREVRDSEWPFSTIEPARYRALPLAEHQLVEAYARGVLDEWERRHPAKSPAARA